MKKALVSEATHTLVRNNPKSGFLERLVFVGSLKQKPAGWRVATPGKPTQAMVSSGV